MKCMKSLKRLDLTIKKNYRYFYFDDDFVESPSPSWLGRYLMKSPQNHHITGPCTLRPLLLGYLHSYNLVICGAWGSARCGARSAHIALGLVGLGQCRTRATVRRNTGFGVWVFLPKTKLRDII